MLRPAVIALEARATHPATARLATAATHCNLGQAAVYRIQFSALPSCCLMPFVKCWLPKLLPKAAMQMLK